jgi:hypothetical protein
MVFEVRLDARGELARRLEDRPAGLSETPIGAQGSSTGTSGES